MAHGLQADGIKDGGERRKVVGDQIDLDDHAGGQNEDAHNQKADATIEKDAAQHEERGKQSEAGEKRRSIGFFEPGFGEESR